MSSIRNNNGYNSDSDDSSPKARPSSTPNPYGLAAPTSVQRPLSDIATETGTWTSKIAEVHSTASSKYNRPPASNTGTEYNGIRYPAPPPMQAYSAVSDNRWDSEGMVDIPLDDLPPVPPIPPEQRQSSSRKLFTSDGRSVRNERPPPRISVVPVATLEAVAAVLGRTSHSSVKPAQPGRSVKVDRPTPLEPAIQQPDPLTQPDQLTQPDHPSLPSRIHAPRAPARSFSKSDVTAFPTFPQEIEKHIKHRHKRRRKLKPTLKELEAQEENERTFWGILQHHWKTVLLTLALLLMLGLCLGLGLRNPRGTAWDAGRIGNVNTPTEDDRDSTTKLATFERWPTQIQTKAVATLVPTPMITHRPISSELATPGEEFGGVVEMMA